MVLLHADGFSAMSRTPQPNLISILCSGVWQSEPSPALCDLEIRQLGMYLLNRTEEWHEGPPTRRLLEEPVLSVEQHCQWVSLLISRICTI